MKKLFTILTTAILCLSMLFSLAACGETGHTHAFNKEVVNAQTLATEATCSAKAKYYYSCDCGEKGTDTFESGTVNANAHDFNDYACSLCGEAEGSTQNLAYEVNAEDTGWIVIGIGYATETEIIIPEKIDGLPVVAIGERAFYSNKEITSVKLCKNVKTIGYGAFQDTLVEQVILNEGLNYIDGQAFSSVPNLTKIIIPASVTEIQSTVFNGWTATSTIYCRAASKPDGWVGGWEGSSCHANIVWGYTGN